MFKLEIETDNAAFTDEADEIARILKDLADKIENGAAEVTAFNDSSQGRIRDINGNTVGTWHYTSEDES